jgi:hypothetical protein
MQIDEAAVLIDPAAELRCIAYRGAISWSRYEMQISGVPDRGDDPQPGKHDRHQVVVLMIRGHRFMYPD